MNFCFEKLGTKIESDKVSFEGYEVENLLFKEIIAEKSFLAKNNKGFMASHFLRPPLTITITFPICIEVSHIIIGTTIGQQKISGIQLESEVVFKRRGQEIIREKQFISREFFNKNLIPSTVTFKNHNFVPRFCNKIKSQLSTDQISLNDSTNSNYQLKHQNCVSALYITILQASGSSVPVISSLQIWGQPSQFNNSKESVSNILNLWNDSIEKSSNLLAPPKRKLYTEEDTKAGKISKTDILEIPEEFMDQLTYEIMCVPIRLPSGKCCDSENLEKFYKEEAIWGRLPSDPFTGQNYTDTLKPVVDTVLKSRIDAFLTKNSEENSVKFLPRILGSSPAPSASTSSQKSQCISLEKNLNNNFSVPPLLLPTTNEVQKNDLNLSPADILNRELNKFLSKSIVNKNKQDKKCCIFCKILYDTNSKSSKSDNFYKGNCAHIIICRNCLLKCDRKAENKCSHCYSIWRGIDCSKIN